MLTTCARAHRVAPVLKQEIDAGNIKLKAIVNTHQYVLILSIASRAALRSETATAPRY